MKEPVISTEVSADRRMRSGEICINKTDVSTEFILSVVEGLDMTARFVTNKQINK